MTTEAGRTGRNTSKIFFPLDQGERAAQRHVNQLLPRDVYERLAELIGKSVRTRSGMAETDAEFLETKAHRAVFIDGDRGTGKTTVAVNLRAYLESPESKRAFGDLAGQVHVLKPIDPTQLEDSDDLFLNVIVAAVLSDEDIKKAQERYPGRRQQLHQKLQALGDALQGRETQKENYGLDRLRSFMGTQALAFAVHEFFLAALSLLDKKLLAMPIDDVDTSLHKAFDYLEVVRRYLSSDVVLPIVCGDFSLYREVTQRDAYRRFTVEGRRIDRAAETVTSKLAVEYLRKVLPVQRRLQMPNIETLLSDARIVFLPPSTQEAEKLVSLPQFRLWLRVLLEGPVNGHENSSLHIPIPTVRALSQLVGSIQKQFSSLERILCGEEPDRPSTNLAKRLWRTLLEPRVPGDAPLRATSRPAREPVTLEPDAPLTDGWHAALLEHFRFVPDGGHVCLVLLAARHWKDNPKQSVLATPLFMPLTADDASELKYSDRNAKIHWRDELKGRVPSPWLSQLPDALVIPFATPEIGRAVKFSEGKLLEVMPSSHRLLLTLAVHENFYSERQQASLLCTGRILELLATSLVRDVSVDDIDRIAALSPFHSVAAIAKTKTISISGEEGRDSPDTDVKPPSIDDVDLVSRERLAKDINDWRTSRLVNQLVLSPWLVYCALNKTLNQSLFFNPPLPSARATWSEAVDLAHATFNSFWAACASFEKGPAFGLPLVLASVNLTTQGDFEKNNLYLQNVSQVVSNAVIVSEEGDQVLSVTRLLADHPLRTLIMDVRKTLPTGLAEPKAARLHEANARTALLEALRLRPDMAQLRESTIVNALIRQMPDPEGAKRLGRTLLKRFAGAPGLQRELRTLERALARLG